MSERTGHDDGMTVRWTVSSDVSACWCSPIPIWKATARVTFADPPPRGSAADADETELIEVRPRVTALTRKRLDRKIARAEAGLRAERARKLAAAQRRHRARPRAAADSAGPHEGGEIIVDLKSYSDEIGLPVSRLIGGDLGVGWGAHMQRVEDPAVAGTVSDIRLASAKLGNALALAALRFVRLNWLEPHAHEVPPSPAALALKDACLHLEKSANFARRSLDLRRLRQEIAELRCALRAVRDAVDHVRHERSS